MREVSHHWNLVVRGRVQGVGFRANARAKAFSLGLTGFVKNLSDGSVYMELEGDLSSLSEMHQWCRKGPAFARVESVDRTEGEVQSYTAFRIA